MAIPQAVSGISDATTLTGGFESYCAVLVSGGTDCWGRFQGQLGIGSTGGPDGADGYDTPQPVSGITSSTAETAMAFDPYGSYCALLNSGGVDCWGSDSYGELSNGTTGDPGYDEPQVVLTD